MWGMSMTASSDFPVEEILARCLTEPSFLALLIADRDTALDGYSLDPETLADFARTDLERIRQFSGFIGKVQHNYLWDWFPATRKLLHRYAIEIEFFSEYRAIQLAGELRSLTQSEKIRRFADYLALYTDNKPEFNALAALLRYEYACWELHDSITTGSGTKTAQDAGPLSWAEFQELTPEKTMPTIIESFDCNPVQLVAQVLDGEFVQHHREENRWFVFQLNPLTMNVRLSEVEALPALLLFCIDGQRRVRSVIAAARRRGLASIPPKAFRSFLEGAAAAGFIVFHQAGSCA
jgi:hypothetical protein